MPATPSTASYPADYPRFQPSGIIRIHYCGTDVVVVRPDVGDTLPLKITTPPTGIVYHVDVGHTGRAN